MRRILVLLGALALSFSLAVPSSAASTHHRNLYGMKPGMMSPVERVHHCEEPAWNVDGPVYSGGLGWLHATWAMFRKPWWPADMANASPFMQGNAMWRFIWYYHIPWPDQHGCTGGY